MKVNGQKMLNCREVAEILSLTPRTIRRLNEEGKLPAALKIGGSLRWSPTQLESFLEGKGGDA